MVDSVMRWAFVIAVFRLTFGQRPDSVHQGLAQGFQFADLCLLVCQRFIQGRQRVLLVGQLGLDFDYPVFVHGYHRKKTSGMETLRP